jgi:hypothetical protein
MMKKFHQRAFDLIGNRISAGRIWDKFPGFWTISVADGIHL